MLHGLANGVFLDDQRFWPIYERAAKLDVPVYLHPGAPQQAVVDRYYKEYVQGLAGAAATPAGASRSRPRPLAIRMVLSGVFEKHPEPESASSAISAKALPFLMWRMDQALSRLAASGTVPRYRSRATSGDDQRLLLQPGTALHHAGARHRPHHVRDRLAVREEHARRWSG